MHKISFTGRCTQGGFGKWEYRRSFPCCRSGCTPAPSLHPHPQIWADPAVRSSGDLKKSTKECKDPHYSALCSKAQPLPSHSSILLLHLLPWFSVLSQGWGKLQSHYPTAATAIPCQVPWEQAWGGGTQLSPVPTQPGRSWQEEQLWASATPETAEKQQQQPGQGIYLWTKREGQDVEGRILTCFGDLKKKSP